MSASQLTLCCHVTALLRQSRLLGPHMSLLAALRHAVSLPEHLALLLTAGLRAAALQGGRGCTLLEAAAGHLPPVKSLDSCAHCII